MLLADASPCLPRKYIFSRSNTKKICFLLHAKKKNTNTNTRRGETNSSLSLQERSERGGNNLTLVPPPPPSYRQTPTAPYPNITSHHTGKKRLWVYTRLAQSTHLRTCVRASSHPKLVPAFVQCTLRTDFRRMWGKTSTLS